MVRGGLLVGGGLGYGCEVVVEEVVWLAGLGEFVHGVGG